MAKKDEKAKKLDIARPKFRVDDEVFKPEGYPFPGTVVAVFLTAKGNLRYVVEHDCRDLLHIFSEHQLKGY